MIVNFVNLVSVIVGFMILIYSFGKDLERSSMLDKEYPNFLAFCSALLAGLFLGYAFG